jgi:hypothetical protein
MLFLWAKVVRMEVRISDQKGTKEILGRTRVGAQTAVGSLPLAAQEADAMP